MIQKSYYMFLYDFMTNNFYNVVYKLLTELKQRA